MTEATVIRCTNPTDVLATLPRLVGFTPCPGVYLIPFAGKRSSGAVRIDLPEPDLIAPHGVPHPTQEALDWMVEVAGLVSFAKRVAIVIYSDAPFADQSGAASYYGLAKMLAYSLRSLEVEVNPLPILQSSDGYAELTHSLVRARPITEITEHEHYPASPLPSIDEWRAARESAFPDDAAARAAWQRSAATAAV